jgi:hypothetical protein
MFLKYSTKFEEYKVSDDNSFSSQNITVHKKIQKTSWDELGKKD